MARAPRKVNRKTASQLLDDHLSEDFEMERPVKAAKGSDKGEIVRVWWEPTRDKDRTGFAGAYWPAKVVRKTSRYLEVEYDNGERDKCDPDNIFPHDVPIDFGKEVYDLQVGEFVEVSNNSTTDPCAWLGCVASVGKKYLIDYPFHDSPSEYIRPELLRRARVWDEVDWKYIQLGQKWKPGDVASPLELNLLTDDDYFQQLKQTFGGLKSSSKVKADADAAAAESAGEAAASSQDDEQQQAAADEQQKSSSKKRSRSRKPDKPSRAALDEASNGSGDDKPKGAKKRKPTSVRQA
eukprot:GHUV01007420.1.p1 GENE.GHUV01007420.1~~GHUV01007420.1.p1  ORF type:complete len:329 (+),score=78.93 GHUV01007420.1:106-987(+)